MIVAIENKMFCINKFASLKKPIIANTKPIKYEIIGIFPHHDRDYDRGYDFRVLVALEYFSFLSPF